MAKRPPLLPVLVPPVLAVALSVGIAAAHPFQVSGLTVEVNGSTVDVKQDLDGRTLADVLPFDEDGDGAHSAEELSRAEPKILAYLEERLVMDRGGRCTPDPPRRLEPRSPGPRLLVERTYRCPGAWGPLSIDNRVFMDDPGGHRHVASVRLDGRVVTHEFLVGDTDLVVEPEAPAPSGDPASAAPPTPPRPFLGWIREGTLHVLAGLDHVLFVLGLALTVEGWRRLVWMVSAFTVAHTLTLALGALDVVRLPSALVETLIALSVLWIGVEAVRGGDAGRRGPALAFGFGLVHGLAFGTLLTELGLPGAGLVAPLLGFNVGVELAQLVVLAPTYPLLAWLRRRPEVFTSSRRVFGCAIALVASLWVVERGLGVSLLPS